ncbi:MAG: inositol monophosphatase family protein, partial [Desulfatiglandales bacterium]|nr:inositol monophosphatase family protein [Desulfatiglandales bacterium]
MKHPEMLAFSIETAKDAGSILMSHFGKISSVDRKSTNIDLLTIADTESEAFILERIKSVYPDHHIIAEESAIWEGNSDYRWVIDPLDGTTNFVHSLPIFAVSIGLQYKQETILSVVHNPAAHKCFWAEKNGGAYLNDKPIQITSTNTLSNSLLVTGFPYIHDDRWEKGFELFKTLYCKTQGIRRLGAAALDFCFVAMGRFDGFWEFGLQPWDVCAGAIILEEA